MPLTAWRVKQMKRASAVRRSVLPVHETERANFCAAGETGRRIRTSAACPQTRHPMNRSPVPSSFPRRGLATALAVSCLAALAAAERPAVPAFPGAEGGGAITSGGRGGRTIEVTNLADAGPGSFREAVTASGPRTVVFRVSGIVRLQSPLLIESPFLTVAGQTAPGDGICIAGDTTTVNASDVVVRYVRFRRGNLKDRDDGLNAIHSPGRIILDHCSFSWGLDENVSFYRYIKPVPGGKDLKLPIENLTIQWCISSEALNPNHHAFGGTWGGRNASFHHNLFASNTGRNPSIGFGNLVDFRNNVVFNWQHRTLDGGDATSWLNVVANYFKPGPATNEGALRHRIARPEAFRDFHENPEQGHWYVAENFVFGNERVTRDNWDGGVQFEDDKAGSRREEIAALLAAGRTSKPVPTPPVVQQTAEQAYELVLARAGATLPRRDPVDERVIASVRSGKPAVGNGIVNSPEDVGGYPEYRSVPAPADGDHDGMPDAWERAHGLNADDPADAAADADKDGYTNLEEFLNGTDPKKFVDYTRPENNVSVL